jgi:O-antigen ligase
MFIGRYIKKKFRIVVDIFSLLSILFFLTKADIFFSKRNLLFVDPATLFVLLSSLLLYYAALFGFYSNRYVWLLYKSLSIILPFAFLVWLSLISIFYVDFINFSDRLKFLFLPFFDFYVFLVGVFIGGFEINRKLMRRCMFLGLLITVTTISIDAIFPGTFSSLSYRAAGFAENPNAGAVVTSLFMIAALDWDKKRITVNNFMVILLALIGVCLTLSRSGILIYMVVVLYCLFHTLNRRSMARVVKIGLLLSCFSVLILFAVPLIIEYVPIFQFDSFRKSLFSGDLNEFLRSDEVRLAVTHKSIDMISEHPISGWGTGHSYAMPVGPHNMYLARWIDNGIFGIITYIWFLAASFLFNRRYMNPEGRMLVLLIAMVGLFSHNVLENRTFLLLLGISSATAVVRYSSMKTDVTIGFRDKA